MDLSKRLFDEILVERDGYVFKLAVVYERLPDFCHHFHVIGHHIAACKWLHSPRIDNKEANEKKLQPE
ncbi:pre-mRNA-processing factor, partial [Trifolium medium]|nr:pre-mRNA-processing factor [Trifolium medium]